MQIQDFNGSAAAPDNLAASAPADGPAAQAVAEASEAEDRASVEIALLKAQVEHLELVVETARNLMTSNQERLLRRLHDLPREMAALSARLDRFDNPGRSGAAAERTRASIRRVV